MLRPLISWEEPMDHEKNLQAGRSFLNEASNSLSLAEVEIDKLQKKADDAKPLAAKYDALLEKYNDKERELQSLEKKLADVRAAHEAFAKLVAG